MKETKEYIEGRSYLTVDIDEAQEIVNSLHGMVKKACRTFLRELPAGFEKCFYP
ncbi:polymorphic toxin type 50 domain-containing protein [uncultured Acidaminococcus sp.]|uniref:polymorphic toxin type 50 domain-containing protein n=1 Tax=uncultured Acidaminococcus sp. TaxID=352152 RepID=UPI0034302344